MATSRTRPTTRDGLLDAARAGDDQAFRALMDTHRRELHAHCYRMLGSVHDADDALQDTLLGAWRGLAGFAGRSSLRTWLFTIATNACLTLIERRPRRGLPVDLWIEPYADRRLGPETGYAAPAARYEQRESVELAFVAAFQHLPATQRAVLLLRDVLGFTAKEAATALDTSAASVTSALQRARDSVRSRLPERSEQANLRALGDTRLQALVEAYVDAWERGDADAILAMLADDATFSMPPHPRWYRGRADIAAFLPRGPLAHRWRLVPLRVNGQLAFGCYRWDAEQAAFLADSVDVLSLRAATVARITAFHIDGSLQQFGLPDQWSGRSAGD